MPEPYNDPIICERCGDILHEGDDYYDTPIGRFCSDCLDAMAYEWRHYVGDTIERC